MALCSHFLLVTGYLLALIIAVSINSALIISYCFQMNVQVDPVSTLVPVTTVLTTLSALVLLDLRVHNARLTSVRPPIHILYNRAELWLVVICCHTLTT